MVPVWSPTNTHKKFKTREESQLGWRGFARHVTEDAGSEAWCGGADGSIFLPRSCRDDRCLMRRQEMIPRGLVLRPLRENRRPPYVTSRVFCPHRPPPSITHIWLYLTHIAVFNSDPWERNGRQEKSVIKDSSGLCDLRRRQIG